jgi:hypothetical protein
MDACAWLSLQPSRKSFYPPCCACPSRFTSQDLFCLFFRKLPNTEAIRYTSCGLLRHLFADVHKSGGWNDQSIFPYPKVVGAGICKCSGCKPGTQIAVVIFFLGVREAPHSSPDLLTLAVQFRHVPRTPPPPPNPCLESPTIFCAAAAKCRTLRGTIQPSPLPPGKLIVSGGAGGGVMC